MQKILMAFVITAVLVGPVVMHDTSRLAYATPQLVLNPISGSPGSQVSFSITGQAVSTLSYPYQIMFNGAPVYSGTIPPGPSTGVSGTFTVPAGSNGVASVLYSGYQDATGIDQVTTTFAVTGSSGTASIPSSVTIAGTCGISTTGALQYGTLIPGATSPEQTLTVQNTGTVSAALFVSGTNWLDGSSVNQINAANTKWSTVLGTAFAGKTALTTSPVMMTSTLDISPSTLPTYWQLQANLNHGTFTGSLTQTVLLSVSC